MTVKRAAFDAVASMLITGVRVLSAGRASQVLANLSERLAPIVTITAGTGVIKFFCPSPMPEWRARTLMTKEPETIAWINGFDKSDVLWDVGANVGIYSLYAASRGISVLAFEPAPGNAYLLSRNVELNAFDKLVSSYCLAFSDQTRLDSFHMSNTDLGGALSSFGEATDWKGGHYITKFLQAMIGFSIDDFIKQFSPPFPTHIKIDVDGIEKKIVLGAAGTLSDQRVKSVLIELNDVLPECDEIISLMNRYGLELRQKQHADQFYPGEARSVFNHIFSRKA